MGEKSEILLEGGKKVVEATKQVARVGTWAVTSAALVLNEKTDMI